MYFMKRNGLKLKNEIDDEKKWKMENSRKYKNRKSKITKISN